MTPFIRGFIAFVKTPNSGNANVWHPVTPPYAFQCHEWYEHLNGQRYVYELLYWGEHNQLSASNYQW